MKSSSHSRAGRSFLLLLLSAEAVFLGGCTSALWDKETFAHHYRPANPVNLRLYYSSERKDILVQYDESKDADDKSRTRSYWLEPNTLRVNRDRKPHFASPRAVAELSPLKATEAPANPSPADSAELYAVARRDDPFFALYSGKEPINTYKLPTYKGRSQRVKQVLLTPFAVAFDATLVGALIGYHSAPGIFANLSGR